MVTSRGVISGHSIFDIKKAQQNLSNSSNSLHEVFVENGVYVASHDDQILFPMGLLDAVCVSF